MKQLFTILFVFGFLLFQLCVVRSQFSNNTQLNILLFVKDTKKEYVLALKAAANFVGPTLLVRSTLNANMVYMKDGCNRRTPVAVFVYIFKNYRDKFSKVSESFQGIIVDNCEQVCADLATLGEIFKISVITYGCKSQSLSHQSGYQTFARSITVTDEYSQMMRLYARQVGWERAVVYQEQVSDNPANIDDAPQNETLSGPNETFSEGGEVDIKVFSILPTNTFHEIVANTKDKTRVIGLNLNNELKTMRFLTAAKEQGLYNGEYAFITKQFRRIPIKRFLSSSAITGFNRTAVQRVLDELNFLQTGLLSINVVKSSKEMQEELRGGMEIILGAPEIVKLYDLQNVTISQDLSDVAYAFDAVFIWGNGLLGAAERTTPKFNLDQLFGDETRALRTAQEIIQPNQFEGLSGLVIMNPVTGDRILPYTLVSLQNQSSVVIGDFLRNESKGKYLITLVLRNGSNVSNLLWPGFSHQRPVGYPVPCGWDDVICAEINKKIIIGCVFGGIGFIALSVAAFLIIYGRYQAVKGELMAIDAWTIKYKDLIISRSTDDDNRNSSNTDPVDPSAIDPRLDEESAAVKTAKPVPVAPTGINYNATYRNVPVTIQHITSNAVNYTGSKILLEIKQMRGLNHDNITMFIGVCVDPPHVSIVMALASKGSLHHVMIEKGMEFSIEISSSFLFDIARGMEYLHSTAIGSHGHLTSLTCVIDHRWGCKVTDYGLGHFRSLASKSIEHQQQVDHPFQSRESRLVRKYPFWTAPELLRMPVNSRPLQGTKKGDVYSFAIIMQEVLIKQIPFGIDLETLTPFDIMEKVKAKMKFHFRPTVPMACCDPEWINLMSDAWTEDPMQRPSFRNIVKRLEQMGGQISQDMAEKLMVMLEMYATHLEDLVIQRTRQTEVERERAASLLYSILPPVVADGLKKGQTIPAETFRSVTMFYSDIVGFTKLAAASTPLQIVELLGLLYHHFDEVVDDHDAYKVETIGDAYVISSGLPIPNGTRHAREISDIALKILSFTFTFVIPHLPERPLEIRIGLHSGPVVTGVLGVKMPRYCLFGETVAVANKMESSSVANHIHVSYAVAELLRETMQYELFSRGQLQLKGQEAMETFFLLGKDGLNIPLPHFTPEKFPNEVSSGH